MGRGPNRMLTVDAEAGAPAPLQWRGRSMRPPATPTVDVPISRRCRSRDRFRRFHTACATMRREVFACAERTGWRQHRFAPVRA
jgi:hypothetical protein